MMRMLQHPHHQIFPPVSSGRKEVVMKTTDRNIKETLIANALSEYKAKANPINIPIKVLGNDITIFNGIAYHMSVPNTKFELDVVKSVMTEIGTTENEIKTLEERFKYAFKNRVYKYY